MASTSSIDFDPTNLVVKETVCHELSKRKKDETAT